ncbi:MAG: flavodoxin family protein [Clostridium tyrobutyricum]|jgi:multimeric flavodoxin WrbA|uniref:flavodoxin family protein n=1 Tax=Clostridium tyrobutyricum TaxID=1519 RepID=UPI001C38FD0F|nr:flavodoxin family protein [Clostridium tyrobutyricum]MBV4425820.1 flavodoxin family protein [Clostridium tyrobutyricum]MCH4199822.1 flavodoxin family protein [Clostridium tyrobutyricum]MCH4237654.1 flavodoxin family protein [Clostridium tyrobutyricum]MCH4258339.1 flavodoxin family protein [Clostridium tyrobutyricum]MCI1239508.1 flavodoxin family protein [Clostridium tyrobutyricum]
MKVIAINGSPRKNGNTSILLNKALEGARSQRAETELINLYDIDFKGCTSCFACKIKGGSSYGKCIMKDELSPVLEKVNTADALILGTPVYFWNVTGEMRCFMERFLFPITEYTLKPKLTSRKMHTALIYTMNITEKTVKEGKLDEVLFPNERILKRFFGECESMYCTDTYQFSDYSKVVSDKYDEKEKARRHKEVFPEDCQKAFDIGVRFAK